MSKPTYNLDGTGGSCAFCGKSVEPHLNYCDWDCHIGHAKKLGGRVHTPNGLPINCIMHDSTMLEIADGDHPDYKWPVKAQYIGPVTADDREFAEHACGLSASATDDEVRESMGETHALLYSDEIKSVTIYECCYATWDTKTGLLEAGSLWARGRWKLVSIEPPARPAGSVDRS